MSGSWCYDVRVMDDVDNILMASVWDGSDESLSDCVVDVIKILLV